MAELLAREFDLLCKITKCTRTRILPITTLAYYISLVLIYAQFCQSIQGCGFYKILKLLETLTTRNGQTFKNLHWTSAKFGLPYIGVSPIMISSNHL